MGNSMIYLGILATLLLIVISFFGLGFLNPNSSKEFNSEQIIDSELEKYRSEDIPEDCRLPEYESDIESWKQHLSHHKQTWYCLEYYGTSIEEMNKNK